MVRRFWEGAVRGGYPGHGETLPKGYQLRYYSFMRPSFREFRFDDNRARRVEVIDTWNMTVEFAGVFTGRFRVPLPSRPYMAIRMRFA